jgi:CRP-like cAMP-binding protein
MASDEIRQSILALEFMRGLPADLRARLAELLEKISDVKKVPEGGTWIREGEHGPNKGYVLLKGEVEVRKSDSPDIDCQAPQLLGEMMQFTPAHLRTATVVAATDCVVLRFLWDDFWAETGRVLSESEFDVVKEALKDVAWGHLAG